MSPSHCDECSKQTCYGFIDPERVEFLIGEIDAAHEEARANASAASSLMVRDQYVGRAWALGQVLDDLRALTSANRV